MLVVSFVKVSEGLIGGIIMSILQQRINKLDKFSEVNLKFLLKLGFCA